MANVARDHFAYDEDAMMQGIRAYRREQPRKLRAARAAELRNLSAIRPEPVNRIIASVAKACAVSQSEVLRRSMEPHAVQPRQLAMMLAHDINGYSLRQVGGYFGGYDHSTVMHAVATARARCAQNPLWKETLHQVQKVLRGAA